MYCTECGRSVTEAYKFCPACGQSTILVDREPSTVRSGEIAELRREPQGVALSSPAQSKIPLIGTIVFAAFSLVTLVAGAARGLPIVSILEAAGWAIIAWVWHRKRPTDAVAGGAVATLAMVVLVGELFLLANPSAARVQTASNPFDALDNATGQQADKAEFVPPDKPEISAWDGSASCQEATRLTNLCTAQHFVSSNPYAKYGGDSTPLGALGSLPTGFQLEPSQQTCTTAVDWNNYCNLNRK